MRFLPLIISILVLAVLVVSLIYFSRSSREMADSEPKPEPPPTEPPSYKIVHPPRGFVPHWESLDAYQETISAEELTQLIENVYVVGGTWKEVITINETEATIKTDGDPFVLRLRPKDTPAPETVERYWKVGPLDTLHIAIDPGHIGGDFAAIEARQFGRPEDRPVREGEISLLAAKHLKPLLESMGAQVSLVRKDNSPVTEKRSIDFLELYRDYNPDVPDGLLIPYAEKRFYRRAEIVDRARLVNEVLQPDLVLCLHYNASSDSGAWLDPSQPILVDENHFHLLLNGAYTSGEVLDEGDRFQMMERILQRIHKREAELAKVVADVFADRTGLPAYSYDPDSKRAKNVDGHPYLWARNLLANRSYTCPVLFFEPWVMNNKEVYARIQEGDYEGTRKIGDEEMPSIMREYAETVAAGIKEFFSR